jgi:hypothetical protein
MMRMKEMKTGMEMLYVFKLKAMAMVLVEA